MHYTCTYAQCPSRQTSSPPSPPLSALVAEALSGFSVPEVVRVARLKDGLSVLELFHGQTLAFKDLAMTCTVRFLDYFLRKEKLRATVVVGESLLTLF